MVAAVSTELDTAKFIAEMNEAYEKVKKCLIECKLFCKSYKLSTSGGSKRLTAEQRLGMSLDVVQPPELNSSMHL
jgi:hypothetical protein